MTLMKFDLILCEILNNIEIFIIFFSYRLEKNRANNNYWIDQIKDELCRVIHQRKQLITIFKFDSEKHHGNLEDAILEALFNGENLQD